MAQRSRAGIALAAIGVIVLLWETGLHAWTVVRHILGIPGEIYELSHLVLIVGVVLGFVGFYLINPKGAEEGTDVITRSVVSIASVFRIGRRTGDVVTVVAPATQPVTPTKRDDESAGG